jgi:dolichol-phosphate mannosyltransferase
LTTPPNIPTTQQVISYVVPVRNEKTSLSLLLPSIILAAAQCARRFEVIFVDDGSSDASWSRIEDLAQQYAPLVRAICFRCNVGKADALAAGIRAARGDVVFTLDGDLQDDPKEIPRFLTKLDEGYDIVTGWKRVRHDPWHKVWPSRVFNWMLSVLSGVKLHDHNCGFKCYRAEVVRDLVLYGGMHRMIPALAWFKGYRCAEIEVEHHPRRFGRSKYGFRRFLMGFLDLLTVFAIRKFRDTPLHLAAMVAFFAVVIGGSLLGIGLLPWLGSRLSFAVTIVGGCFVGAMFPLLGMGLLAELAVFARMGGKRKLPICAEIGAEAPLTGQEAEKIVSLSAVTASGTEGGQAGTAIQGQNSSLDDPREDRLRASL